MATERLQKLLAAAGHGSRRQIEAWIRAGRITVDGQIAALGLRAEPGADIRLDGQPLRALGTATAREVLLYHKPLGEVTTRSDPQRRPTVFERLPAPKAGRWVVIGRLDVNTTGLLLFTTDGALAHRLMHPSSEIEREYHVRVSGVPSEAELLRLRSGLMLDDGPGRFDIVERLEARAGRTTQASHAHFRVVLREGRNREVRRLWQSAGYEVSRLMRVRFGSIELPHDLRAGQWRRLGGKEAAKL